ncbi:MAG: restriction endonuclease subunit S [Pseudomonadota bacterium]
MKGPTLGEVVDLQRGNTYKSKLIGDHGLPLLGLGSIARDGGFRGDALRLYPGPTDPRHVLVSGDIYVSLKDVTQSGDLLGAVARLPPDIPQGRLTQDTVKLIQKSDYDADMLYWALRTPQYRAHCRAHAMGTTNLSISRKDFLAFELPESTQATASLVELLGALDDKIELNRRMGATLEGMARALYRSWFVDFDPVRAKMEGHAPAHMDPATAALFPDRLGKDGLPEGWKLRELRDLLTLNYGKALRKDRRVPGPYPVVGSGGDSGSHKDALVSGPTIVVGRKGTVGSIHWRPKGCWPIDTAFYATSELPDSFVLESLREQPLADMNTDAAVPGLNRENAYRLEVPWGGDAVITAFSATAGLLRARADAAEDEAQSLAALRDALLPRLMSGELRVPVNA